MKRKEKILFFITDCYPAIGEVFVENEMFFLSNKFKVIYVISLNSEDRLVDFIPKNCKIFRLKIKKYRNFFKFLFIFFDILYIRDFFKNIKIKNIKKIIYFLYISKMIENKCKKIMKIYKINKEDVYYYSYWFNSGAYAGIILKRKKLLNRVISRAHRYDLYLESGEQLFKNEILKFIDMVYPCSKMGEEYLKNLYKKNNIKYNYLGTINKEKFLLKEKGVIIVSCSNIISVKRVELIIKTLNNLEKRYRNLKWVHFGSGQEEKKMKKLANEKLKYIQYEFKGQVKNEEVLKYYRENKILLFLNLSSSEGLPVSMMEAQSYGIPIIATNVGGTKEIVNNKVGILLSSNPEINEIVNAIEKIINLSNEEYKKYRINSYKNWNEKFNAEKNYENFIKRYLK